MSAATPQEGILILLKISIALRFEPYRRSGKLGLYHNARARAVSTLQGGDCRRRGWSVGQTFGIMADMDERGRMRGFTVPDRVADGVSGRDKRVPPVSYPHLAQ